MEEYKANFIRSSKPVNLPVNVLSQDEQKQLIRTSHDHPFGILIRLAIATGIKEEELLGLTWDDIDSIENRLWIRREYRVTAEGFILCAASFPRFVSLASDVLQDLLDWREQQRNIFHSTEEPNCRVYFVAATPGDYRMASQMLQWYFYQILKCSGIGIYPFETLRSTFAARALEQEMPIKTLGKILGDPADASRYIRFLNR